MTPRVGIDLVAIDTVAAALDRHGTRYLDRTFTADEQQACHAAGGPDAARLAACFALKEAAVKVLQPGPQDAVPWTDVEARPLGPGRWTVVLRGRAAELAADAGLGPLAASLTTARGHAAAVVIAGNPPSLPIMAP